MIINVTRKKLKLKRWVKYTIYILLTISILILLFSKLINTIDNNNYNNCLNAGVDSSICEKLKK